MSDENENELLVNNHQRPSDLFQPKWRWCGPYLKPGQGIPVIYHYISGGERQHVGRLPIYVFRRTVYQVGVVLKNSRYEEWPHTNPREKLTGFPGCAIHDKLFWFGEANPFSWIENPQTDEGKLQNKMHEQWDEQHDQPALKNPIYACSRTLFAVVSMVPGMKMRMYWITSEKSDYVLDKLPDDKEVRYREFTAPADGPKWLFTEDKHMKSPVLEDSDFQAIFAEQYEKGHQEGDLVNGEQVIPFGSDPHPFAHGDQPSEYVHRADDPEHRFPACEPASHYCMHGSYSEALMGAPVDG